jgi:peptidyl-dipeptidase Dcp
MSSLVSESIESNPFISEWKTKYGLPPFADIKYDHYKPAVAYACSENIKDVQKIVDCSEPPSFENTVVAYDRTGELLEKVLNVFYNLTSSNSPPELQKIEMELSAPLAEHRNTITTFPGLFERVDAVYRSVKEDSSGSSSLSTEQLRLLERVHLDFVRAGAKMDGEAKARYKVIMMRLAELETKFAQNILEDESSYSLELFNDRDGDLAGLPQDLLDASRQAAIDKQRVDNCYVITLSRSLVEPFLTYSDNRAHRETAWRAWVSRGLMSPDRDNVAVVREILTLRLEQARLHGHSTFAEYATADTMAQTPAAVMDLLQRVWVPAKASCAKEQTAIEDYIKRHLQYVLWSEWLCCSGLLCRAHVGACSFVFRVL